MEGGEEGGELSVGAGVWEPELDLHFHGVGVGVGGGLRRGCCLVAEKIWERR